MKINKKLAAAAVTGSAALGMVAAMSGIANADPYAQASWDGCTGTVDIVALSGVSMDGYAPSWLIKGSQDNGGPSDCTFYFGAGFVDKDRADAGQMTPVSYHTDGVNNFDQFYASGDDNESRPTYVSIKACDSTGCSDDVITRSQWPSDH